MTQDITTHDLIVIGATAGGLSVAEAARRAGVERVHILERGDSVLMPEVIGRNDLAIGYGEKVNRVDFDVDEDMVVVATNKRSRARSWPHSSASAAPRSCIARPRTRSGNAMASLWRISQIDAHRTWSLIMWCSPAAALLLILSQWV